MFGDKELKKLLRAARVIEFDAKSKLVIMSDIHRGDGSAADNFLKNQTSYQVALQYYQQGGFTYIELGDADELWENGTFEEIVATYSNLFELLAALYAQGRYISVYGNHDMIKSDPAWVQKNLSSYYVKHERQTAPLFPDLKVEEAVILKSQDTRHQFLLMHGHQVDPLNSTYWRLARFLVRYLWRPLEALGLNDPTSASKNVPHKLDIDNALTDIARRTGYDVICGHTHQSVFPDGPGPNYYNDGCCVHPRCITGMELSEGVLRHIKWGVQADADGALRVVRTVLEETVVISPRSQKKGKD